MKLSAIAFNREELSRWGEALNKEWLVTNGLGGYASSSVLGVNTRKYHGLLVAAFHPPGDRTVCLSKLDEDIIVGSETYRLGANEFANNTFYPQGYNYLNKFSVAPFPAWTYSCGSVEVNKTVFMSKGRNGISAMYRVVNNNDAAAAVKIYPILTCRHFHSVLDRQKSSLTFTQKSTAKESEIVFQNPAATILCRATEGVFHEGINWVDGLFYRVEAARGEASRDDCFQPGYFQVTLPARADKEFIVNVAADQDQKAAHQILDSMGGGTVNEAKETLEAELAKHDDSLNGFYSLYPQVSPTDWLNWILYEADSFVVGVGNLMAIIAGYPWFEPWGRDTFVSMPGLLLVADRFQEARAVLETYGRHLKNGLIPNFISDWSGEPAYNTVDGTLWFINAIKQYLKYTSDRAFVRAKLWRSMQTIIDGHKKGTSFGIHLDSDGLLAHGSRLTWMDSEVNGDAVTPRAGKAVEIQALWYNALLTMQSVAVNLGDDALAEKYGEMAGKARKSFNEKFWNKSLGCLFDVLEPSGADVSVRPNQLFAISLDYPILFADKWRSVVDVVNRELVTPYGLRTLAPSDSKYRGKYSGDQASRNRAYHNGTIWPWLLGPFVTAYLKTNSYEEQSQERIKQKLLHPFFTQGVRQLVLGSICEVYDGDFPHTPSGCISQAWSVAEPLRAYVEDALRIKPR